MRAHILCIVVFICCCSCNINKSITSSIPTQPVYRFDTAPEKILITTLYDVVAKKFRDNKEELFIRLLDSSLHNIEKEIHKRSVYKTEVITAVQNLSPDSVSSFMIRHGASHMFAISFLDAYFDQTSVEVTKTSEGKKRNAFYNIVSAIGYHFYTSNGDFKDTIVNIVYFHSSRSVLSGALSAGPNIVSNSTQAENMATENVMTYMNSFFPGTAKRTRIIFTTKEFEGVDRAVKAGDYDAAFKESLQLATNTNTKIAAKALYNCAVLSERNQKYDEARKYLSQSVKMYHLNEAYTMLMDYGY